MQSGRVKKRLEAPRVCAERSSDRHGRILVVGEVRKWQALGRELPNAPGMVFVEFQQVDLGILEMIHPKTILSPVLCSSFDCLDLAMRLADLGFAGQYRAMSTQLPDPWLIRREIDEICPDLDFDIVDLARATGQRLT